ncbi:MAG: hypothetical protein IPK13_16225 [Deltaproteobacteria bacterium]|nr:hypothetical protein [Deltaproteobacteria bacterium]
MRSIRVVRVDWTSSIFALLSRVGLGKGARPDEGKAGQGLHTGALLEASADASAVAGPGGVLRGSLLDADGVLRSGLGYAGEDRAHAAKNRAEQANIDRFLAGGDTHEVRSSVRAGEIALAEAAEDARDREARGLWDAGGADKGLASSRKGKDGASDARPDIEHPRLLVREPVSEDRNQARDDGGREGGHGQRDSGEGGGDGHRQDDDEPKQLIRSSWHGEEARACGEEHQTEGLRADDVLGSAHQCRGELSDGGRCLRKPVPGTPYCREHAASYR